MYFYITWIGGVQIIFNQTATVLTINIINEENKTEIKDLDLREFNNLKFEMPFKYSPSESESANSV